MHAARVGTALDSCDDPKLICVEYKGLVFDEPLRFDLLVDECLLVELKAVEILHPSSKAQLFSYMKLLNIPIGLLINFHEPVLKNGISRMILPGANRAEQNGSKDSVIPTLKTFVLFVSFC
jgi:hypothetical protein